MTTEQERAAYQAWIDIVPLAYPGIEHDAFIAGYRAALQSQDRARLQFLAYEGCSINSRERPDGGWEYQIYWEQVMKWQDDWFDSPEEAIDHARRIEGGGE